MEVTERLHILTAISRPDNMGKVMKSLKTAARKKSARDLEIVWHWLFDHEQEHVGGQALKNAMLDGIHDGYVWILDDDTKVHQHFFTEIAKQIREGAQAIVVGQTGEQELDASPENAKLGHIDAGQVVLSREWIGDERLPESHDGDGKFFESLLYGKPGVTFVTEKLSLYNVLRSS